jgi:hypothetical protein
MTADGQLTNMLEACSTPVCHDLTCRFICHVVIFLPPSASYASGSLRTGNKAHRTCSVSVVCTHNCWMEDPWSMDDCESAETSTEACKDLQDLLPVQEHHAHTSISTASSSNKKRKEKTMPFGVSLIQSQVLYWAAQVQQQ